MSLETNYELLEMLHDDGVQTFSAREITTGRALEVHLFIPFGRPDNKVLFDTLRSLPVDARRLFLDLGQDGSTPYVVTDPLPEKGFKAWAAKLTVAAQPKPARSTGDNVRIIQAGQWRTGTPLPEGLISTPKPPPPRAMPAGDITTVFRGPFPTQASAQHPTDQTDQKDTATLKSPGEFTQMFQALKQPDSAPAAPEPIQLVQPIIVQPIQERPPQILDEPGEFTRMFTASKAEPPLEHGDKPPEIFPDPSKTQTGQVQAGEFTRMFQSPQSAVAPQAPERLAPPPNTGASEFTKFFQSPLQPAPHDQQPNAAPYFDAPPMPPPPARRSGEFTDIFGKPAAPQSEQMPLPPPQQQGGFYGGGSATGAFSGPSAGPRQVPSSYSGPSEYTKMMSPTSIPTLGQPVPPPPAAPPVQAANKSMTPVLVLLGALLLIAVLVVAFFAIRR